MKDPNADNKLFILDAIEIGEIETTKDGYRIKDSGQFLGKYLEQVVDFFNGKDADVKEIKAIISQRLKN